MDASANIIVSRRRLPRLPLDRGVPIRCTASFQAFCPGALLHGALKRASIICFGSIEAKPLG